MRRIILAAVISVSGTLAQEQSGPTPNLKEYQAKALEHLWTKTDSIKIEAKDFDWHTLPMEKILTTAAVKERGCSIALLPVKPELTLDSDKQKPTPPSSSSAKTPQPRALPVCSSQD